MDLAHLLPAVEDAVNFQPGREQGIDFLQVEGQRVSVQVTRLAARIKALVFKIQEKAVVVKDGVVAGQAGKKQFPSPAESRKVMVQDGPKGHHQVLFQDLPVDL